MAPAQLEYEPEEQFSPPPVVVAPVVAAPSVVVAAPVVVARPVPAVVAAPVVATAPVAVASAPSEEAAPTGPSLIAIKYLPGVSSSVTMGDSLVVDRIAFTQTAGIEVRLGRYFALRTDGELRNDGRSLDLLGLKLALLPGSMLRPYGSVSLSLSDSPSLPGKIQVGLMGAAGLDLYFGRHFFIEAEVRYRKVPSCCREEPRFTGLVGAGVAFF